MKKTILLTAAAAAAIAVTAAVILINAKRNGSGSSVTSAEGAAGSYVTNASDNAAGGSAASGDGVSSGDSPYWYTEAYLPYSIDEDNTPAETQRAVKNVDAYAYAVPSYMRTPAVTGYEYGYGGGTAAAYSGNSGSAASSGSAGSSAGTDGTGSTQTENNKEYVTLVKKQYAKQTMYRLNDTNYLTYDISTNFDNVESGINNTADRLREILSRHPDLRAYSYYISRIWDCDFFGDQVKIYDYASIWQSLAEDMGITSRKFSIRDFEYFKETGFKTDFHLNYKGSYQVYSDVYDMFAADFPLSSKLTPARELDFDNLYIVGDYITNATFEEYTFTEDEMDIFRTYKYEPGPYKSFVGNTETRLGLEEEYMNGQIYRYPRAGHLFSYYGGLSPDIIRFEFDHPDKPNLMIISDSQGRPARVNIASHFNNTIYVDVEQWHNKDVDIDKLIEDNDISVVLLIGQRSMFELYD